MFKQLPLEKPRPDIERFISIPSYGPAANYLAMVDEALFTRP